MAGESLGREYIEIGVEDETAAGLKEIQKTLQAQMKVAAVKAGKVLIDELGDAADRAGDRMLDEIQKDARRIEQVLDRLEKDRKVVLEAEAQTQVANKELALASRKRFVEFFVKVNATQASREITALAKSMSGLTMLGSFRDNIVALGTSLPQLTVKVAALGSAFAGIVAPLLNAAGAIAPLASSLWSIWPLLLAGPGVALAFGAGIGVLVASFVKLDEATTRSGRRAKQLFDFLGDAMDGLQKAIQANFWDGFIGPLENLVKTLLPQLQVGMTNVAKAMGVQWGAVADAVNRAFSNNRLNGFFDQLVDGTNRATPGFAALWEGLSNIALIGGQFLPVIGDWIAKIGQQFLTWTQTADIAGLISNAATQFGYLLDVVKEVSGIIGGIFTAADTGQSTGLQSLADTLGKISDVVNGPAFQTALGSIFEGAAGGASALADALTPIGDAFVVLAPAIGQVLEIMGGAAATALTAIADALGQPVVADGIVGAFSAIAAMISSINWEMLTPILVSITEAIAKIAPNVGDLINSLLPYLPTIIDLFGQVAEVIGQILPVLLKAFEPLLNDPAVLLAVAGAFLTIAGAIQVLTPVLGIISSLVGIFGSLGAVLPGIASAIGAVVAALGGPVTLIIAAVVAIVGVLTWFFTQTELGRDIVKNVTKAIGDAFTWLYENAIKPAIDWIVDAWNWLLNDIIAPAVEWFQAVFQGIGDVFTWLWETIIKPVIDFIVGYFEFLWGGVKLIIDLIVNYFRFWAAIYKWLWENAIQPALKAIGDFFVYLWETYIKPTIDAIVDGFVWLWENGIKPVIDAIVLGWEALGVAWQWFYDNVVQPVIDAIATAFTWLWENGIKPIIDFVTLAIEGWGIIFRWLYDNVIKPVWDSIMGVFKSSWDWIDQNVFTPFKNGIALIQTAFENVAAALPAIWDTIKKAVAEPINFVLDTVWNNGLRSFWNDLVTELDLKDMKLPKAPLVKFASGGMFKGGGMLPGYTPGRDVHTFYSPTAGFLKMSGGEGIIRPDALRRLGGKRWLDYVNGNRGRRAIGDGQGDKSKGFLGDAFAWVADAVSVIGDFLLNPVKAIDKYLIRGIIENSMGNQNIFGQTIAGLAGNTMRALSHAFDILAPSDGSAAPANAMGWKNMWALVSKVAPWATLNSAYRSPASNAAAGGVKGSYHTQGRAIDLGPANMRTFNMAKSLFPNARELIYTPAGAAQLLNGKSFSGWSDYVKKIHFSHIHVAMKKGGIFDQGGILAPGAFAMNMSTKPEAVFTARQFETIERSLMQMDTIAAQGRGYRPPEMSTTTDLLAGTNVSHTSAQDIDINVIGDMHPERTARAVSDALAEKVAVVAG